MHDSPNSTSTEAKHRVQNLSTQIKYWYSYKMPNMYISTRYFIKTTPLIFYYIFAKLLTIFIQNDYPVCTVEMYQRISFHPRRGCPTVLIWIQFIVRCGGFWRIAFTGNRSRIGKSCASASRRSGTVLITEWSTVQSENDAKDCELALQLTKDILNMHC